MNQIVSVGTSHHVAPIEFREKLAFSEEQLIESLQRLRESDQVQEAVIISTCNRGGDICCREFGAECRRSCQNIGRVPF